jgi:hypothetical protein
MKKLLAILLSLAMLASLAACSGKGSIREPQPRRQRGSYPLPRCRPRYRRTQIGAGNFCASEWNARTRPITDAAG